MSSKSFKSLVEVGSYKDIYDIAVNINILIQEDVPAFLPKAPFKKAAALRNGGHWRTIPISDETLILTGCRVGSKQQLLFSFKLPEKPEYEVVEMNVRTAEEHLSDFEGYIMMMLNILEPLSSHLENQAANLRSEQLNTQRESKAAEEKEKKRKEKVRKNENWGTW